MSAGSTLRKSLNSHKNGGLATAKQREGALGQIDEINTRITSIVDQVNRNLSSLNQRSDDAARVLAALTKLVGQEAVTAEVQRQRFEELEAESAQIAEIIDKAVAAGNLERVRTVSGDVREIVVTTERDPQGVVRAPEKVRAPFGQYDENTRAGLVNLSEGDVLQLDDGSTVTVAEVYKPVTKAPTEPAPEQQSPAEPA